MTETTAVASRAKQQITLRERINNAGGEFRKALPVHIPVDKFVRTVQTAITMNPDIAKACNTPDGLQSLMTACTKAATDGLILDGREAALVPFGGKVTYMPMVAGLMKKARNSGEIASIAAHVVYEQDTFTYILGDDERVEHAPFMGGDRGAPIAVYAIVRLKDGTIQREVMDKNAVMKIAAQSKNAAQYNPTSGKNFGEWWRKTVIRRISKYLPSSSDRDGFMQAVERIDEGFDYEPDENADVVVPTPGKKRGGAAAALKDITPEPTEDATEFDADTGEVIEREEFPDGMDMQTGDDI